MWSTTSNQGVCSFTRELTRPHTHSLKVVRDHGLERLHLSFQVVTSNVEPKPLPSEQVCRLEEFYRLFLEVAGCKLDPITSVQLTVELVDGLL